MATIQTDNKKRDEHVLKLFKDAKVTFSADISGLLIQVNKGFSSEVKGQITLNGITRDVVFKVSGIVTERNIEAKGTASIRMDDFNLNPPSLAGVYSADNNLELKFEVKADRLN